MVSAVEWVNLVMVSVVEWVNLVMVSAVERVNLVIVSAAEWVNLVMVSVGPWFYEHPHCTHRDISLFLFLKTHVLIVSRSGSKCLINALRVKVNAFVYYVFISAH